jgi:hypothetical protein
MTDDKIALEEAQRLALLASSYTRLPTIIDLWFRMDRDQWLTLLGDNWSVCDNVGAHWRWLQMLLPKVGPVLPMMDTDERAAWDALPDRMTIYRGQRRRQLGASWSFDRAIAERFPFLHRYSGGDPILVTAEVRKRDVLAIKLDREESEAIVLRGRRILSRVPITSVLAVPAEP